MDILILSTVSIPATNGTIPSWEHLITLGHTYNIVTPYQQLPTKRPDVIICMGVSSMGQTIEALRKYPNIKLYIFQWDTYAWVWDKPRVSNGRTFRGEYDYKKYGNLLESATEIWVPSECTGKRVTQWWNLHNWHTILSSVPYWDYLKDVCPKCKGSGVIIDDDCFDIGNLFDHVCGRCDGEGKLSAVSDKGYIYCALREIPDPQWNMLQLACKYLKLPLVMTKHEFDYEVYQETLANCSFIVSHCFELSTGGLSLLEAYYLGKSCLLSDSQWHGGRDYMGERATYFKCADFNDLCDKLSFMWQNRKDNRESLKDGQDWVRKNYSDSVMIDKMLGRINYHANARI